jgi:hypothetical protein
LGQPGSSFSTARNGGADLVRAGGNGSVTISAGCTFPNSGPEQVPPSWFQSMGRASETSECPQGWSASWAQWPNDGGGGFVCNRVIYWDTRLGQWSSAEA